MNYYIDKYKVLIDSCQSAEDYQKAYVRISAQIAGMILGRGFNQSYADYLEQNPIKKEFNTWWNSINNELHIKAYSKPLVKPA